MRAYTQEEPENWDFFLNYATHSYNNTPHSTTGYPPQELLYGFVSPIPLKLTKNPTPTYNYDSYISEFRYRMQHAYKLARERLLDRKEKNKTYFDQKTNPGNFQVNDLVNLRKQVKTHKFDLPYEGPFRIVEITSPVSAKIKKGKKIKRVHMDHLIKAEATYPKIPPEKAPEHH